MGERRAAGICEISAKISAACSAVWEDRAKSQGRALGGPGDKRMEKRRAELDASRIKAFRIAKYITFISCGLCSANFLWDISPSLASRFVFLRHSASFFARGRQRHRRYTARVWKNPLQIPECVCVHAYECALMQLGIKCDLFSRAMFMNTYIDSI